ncbi:MAG: flagellar hook assembly protein FlgD [Pseudomonadota bacterium]
MNTTDSLAQLQNLGLTSPTPLEPETQSVGQTEFLELMLAQFENQDPFEPMENGDFLSQLAEFSTASGIEELQTAFSDFSSSIYSDQALQASSLVGRNVLVASELVRTNGSDPVSGAVEIDSASGSVSVDVIDASGQLVRTIDLGVRQVGNSGFTWDGLDADGSPAAAGIYEFNARVQRADQVESVPTMVLTNVDSVTLGRNGSGVTINSAALGTFSFADVRQIFN